MLYRVVVVVNDLPFPGPLLFIALWSLARLVGVPSLLLDFIDLLFRASGVQSVVDSDGVDALLPVEGDRLLAVGDLILELGYLVFVGAIALLELTPERGPRLPERDQRVLLPLLGKLLGGVGLLDGLPDPPGDLVNDWIELRFDPRDLLAGLVDLLVL